MLDRRDWTILHSSSIFDSGTKRPLLTAMMAESEAGLSISDFVLKPHAPNMIYGQVCAEALCCHLLQLAGLSTPAGLVLNLDEPTAKLVSRATRPVIPGPAFASKFQEDAVLIAEMSTLHPIDALRIFLFDVVVQNRDRLTYNPNVLTTREGLVPIDHEQAFDFCWDGGRPDSIEYLLSSTAIDAHVFKKIAAKEIAGKAGLARLHLQRLLDKVTSKEVNYVEEVCKLIDGGSFDWKLASEHIQNIKQNVESFSEKLAESLT